eukprot:gb/GECH01014079.1/.p1 GENE.gb/GECH01014079.1/~~gb/GECH01014079.1/.p1  ORF type:complete len:306 (+),score=104.55 gb/GECH01014079.1/:1-918(+)
MRCHYEVLGLPYDATDKDIKRSYRRLALVWHPDKNPDNVEEATERFREVQTAYSVLIDPHERRWYDDHRSHILAERRAEAQAEEDAELGDLWSLFGAGAYSGGEDGFYDTYRRAFARIVRVEQRYAGVDPPSFGDRHTSDDGVAAFYRYWSVFATRRPFLHVRRWSIAQAPNRRVRRYMEKENAKERRSARTEYNDMVRQLVRHVRKQDPRVKRAAAARREREAMKAAETEEIAERVAAMRKEKELQEWDEEMEEELDALDDMYEHLYQEQKQEEREEDQDEEEEEEADDDPTEAEMSKGENTGV